MRLRGIRRSCSGRCCRSIGSAATTWRPRSPTHCAPQLSDAIPAELAVGSIVRRVLHIIRVENEGIGNSDAEFHNGNDNRITLSAGARSALRTPSLQILLENIHVTATEDSDKVADKNSKSKKLKHDIIAAIGEMIHEMDTCYDQIVDQALELIHQNEVILTLGSSRTVKEFLLAAKEKNRSFHVYVAEGAPRYQGHIFAKVLLEGLQTTGITDSAIFAMISRVDMVIVGAHAIMEMVVIAPVGMNMVALAAQQHGVAFVVVAGSHKLCPLYPHNPEVLLNEVKPPSDVLDLGEFSNCMDFITQDGTPLLNVVTPAFDYVPPYLIRLFITDT